MINNFNEVICAGFCVDDGSSIRLNFRSWWSLLPRPLGSTNVNVQCLLVGLLVGRPGLDPGTLRVFPERPWTSVSVQICWPDEVQCPPTSADVLSRLNSWLDNWLDRARFKVKSLFNFEKPMVRGLSCGWGTSSQSADDLVTNRLVANHIKSCRVLSSYNSRLVEWSTPAS